MIKIFNTVSEGGQTWAHRMRMLRQVIRTIILLSMWISFAAILWKIYQEHTPLILSTWYYIKAEILSIFGLERTEVSTYFWKLATGEWYGGKNVTLSIKTILYRTSSAPHLFYSRLFDLGIFEALPFKMK